MFDIINAIFIVIFKADLFANQRHEHNIKIL